MPVDTTQIPAQALQALQQSGVQGGDITQILAQLAEMSPDEVSQALAQLGVQIDPATLQQAAEQWVDQAASDASGNPATEDTEGADRTRGIDPADQQEEEAEGETGPSSPAEEEAEGEGENAEIPANARPTGYQGGASIPRAGAAAPAAGGAAMPSGANVVRGPSIPTGAGGTMDDLVSASMMQQATGNPNAAVPVGGRGNVGMPRSASAIPNPRPSGAANNPRMAAMIADLYRSTGGKTGKKRTPSATPR